MSENCKTCRFFDPNQYQPKNEKLVTEGQCRKNPPTAIFVERNLMNGSAITETVWPVVSLVEWCGSYESQPEAALERERRAYMHWASHGGVCSQTNCPGLAAREKP